MNDLINRLISVGIEESEAKKEIAILQKEFTDLNKIKKIVDKRIKTRTPIQYLIGKAYFMDFEVRVNEKVLIPRPETEILVEETVKRRRGAVNRISTALDIGTGSGIIPIALCTMIPNIQVFGIDIDRKIINLADENAARNNVWDRVHLKVCDLFSEDIEEMFRTNKFDLIISNPPYVKENEMQKLRPELFHEPKIALSGSKENKTGLIYYERIIELVKRYKRHDVQFLALEIDPPLVNDLKALLKKEGLTDYEIVKDYGKLDRCLFVYF